MSFTRTFLRTSTRSVNPLTRPAPASASATALPRLQLIANFSSTRRMADSYSQKAHEEPGLTQKLTDARTFLSSHKVVVLTTRSPSGSLHARTMAIAEITKDWKFRFVYDNESYKEKEVENDNHVNISADGTDKNDGWISIAGRASRSNDESLVSKLYTPTLKAWFGDKGDGVHNGEPSDPRITVLEVTVDEIRHYHQVKTLVGQVVDVVSSAVGGGVAKPGEIRTITGQEIKGAWDKGELKEA